MVNQDERLFAAGIYVLSIFFPVIAPLVIWLIKKDESSFIDYHGREYFNFLISYTVYFFVSGLLTLILIGFVALAILGVMLFVFTIIAAIKAFEGNEYRFPLIFRLIK
ncbi:DUF4870 domain-containing protein [Neobacillus sp. C211]|jgi:uncharacterized Tic20 family protein|nr:MULTISPECIES: DUF4870 domain-containing protein [Bacillaceae]MBT2699265.1 DUF4870 domain-containing protein [Bacillus sp. ISL-40]MBT2723467.1 DUF4870 domain-containing protein [Bacillus sp. ISL-46]MBT2737111.1 DUF4870 domain-containing protein [Bacillus sp. ISL-7]MBT2739875.1 DUF4870 domain-containing protein [Bacillus sp. ISL-77]PGY14155.1 DUF4870 domain-containing protein [Bacillus sp. AFS031507]